MPSADLVVEALRIAKTANHSMYDCIYLALARRETTELVTLDRSMAEIAERMGVRVELLL